MCLCFQRFVVRVVKLFVTLACIGFVATGSAVQAQSDRPPASIDPLVRLDFSLLDTGGVSHSLRSEPGRIALVCVFPSTDCPIANGYVPELNRQFLALRDTKSGVHFFGVISDPATTRTLAAD